MSYDLEENTRLNRHGRRSAVAIERKSIQFNRDYNKRMHAKHQAAHRAAGLAYRIAKVKRDVPAIRAFQKKHPKLRKQFAEENRRLGI